MKLRILLYCRSFHIKYFTFAVKPELKVLLKELYSKASDWINIGVFLGVDTWRLNAIRTAENHIPQNCLREIIIIICVY